MPIDFKLLQAELGTDQVELEDAQRAFFSSDVFNETASCDAVLRPKSIADLQSMLRFCAAHRAHVFARGGGLSYTDAYLPTTSPAVVIDTRGLNRIVEINEQDAYVIVEAGVTWATLHQALLTRGWRTPYFGPLSGLQATIGGALSQGSIFLGSACFGSIGDTVLGVEIALADGQTLRTGSWAADSKTLPFLRYFGPDLTGLFVGDAGSLGVKTQVVLRMIPAFTQIDFLSFECVDFFSMQKAMSAIAHTGVASECFAFDPVLAAIRMQRMSLAQDLKTLGQVIKSQGVLQGLKIAAAGRQFVDTNRYSFHLTIEAHSSAELRANLRTLQDLVRQHAPTSKGIDNAIPKLMRSQPFVAPNTMIGPSGERWVPVHGIVAHSQAARVFQALVDYFASQQVPMQQLQIKVGYLMSTVAAQGFLLEPCLYWPDEIRPYHRRIVEAEYLKRVPAHAANPEARALVEQLKTGASAILRHAGAAHFQLGKFYDYRTGRDPAALALFDAIKAQLDPDHRMNPGALR